MAENLDKIQVQQTNEGESAAGKRKWNLLRLKSDKGTVVSEFLTESSLHGLKYIGQPTRHIVERTFWIVTFIVGLVAAGFLINGVFSRYEETPVTVSFQSKEQSVDTIPFPAVTFCYNHQFTKQKVESLKRIKDGLMEGEPEYNAISEKLELIRTLCWSRKTFIRAFSLSTFSFGSARDDYYYIKNQSKLQQEIIDLYLEFTPSCEEMIPLVMLDGKNVGFRFRIFNPVITEYGKCCTFNMLPPPLMLKQPSVGNGNEGDILSNPVLGSKSKIWWNQADIDDWQKWSYEKGFRLSPDSYKSDFSGWNSKLSHPYRNQRLGYHFGLSVVINTFEPYTYCDEVTFQGTTFMLHSPVEIPRVSQFPSVIGPTQEVFIKIHPDITLADPDIMDLQTEKRQCLFGKEQKLKYVSPYTQENCFEDCIANLIEKDCGCTMFFMPRTNETVLCEIDSYRSEGKCVRNTLSLLSKKEVCGHCLPLCEYINYNFEITASKLLNLNNSDFWNGVPGVPIEPEDINLKSSIVHIFFATPSTVPKLRKRLYGTTDLIANTGGILGLCLGFSVLSGAEVLYYVLMRAIWQMLSRRYIWCNTIETSAPGTTAAIEPKNTAKSNYFGSDKKSKFGHIGLCNYCYKKRSVLCKFKWLYCILVGSVVTGFLVYMLLTRNEENVKTKDTFKTPLETDEDGQPYWAVATFCYVNQFSKEKVLEFRRGAESTTDEEHRYSAETNLSIIDAMCKYKNALETSSSSKFPPITPDVANHTILMKFLEENTISCNQMFPACVYMGMVQENCNEIIKPVYTVHGKCCRLFLAPAQPTNSSDDRLINITEQFNTRVDSILADNQNYKSENSYIFSMAFNSSYFVVHEANLSENFSNDIKPFHFSILSNQNQDLYQCDNSTTSTNQILFSLNSPGEFPQIQDFSSLLVANEEVVLTLFPEAESSDSTEEVMTNENKNCLHYTWWDHDIEDAPTTKAARFDGCSHEFISSNCKCALLGNYRYPRTRTCNTESNSTDTICLKKMNELVRKLGHICSCTGSYCKYACIGTTYSYITTNRSMKNPAKLWESLRKFGNDTTSEIPWENNKTGIIHFAFSTSRQTWKSTNNGKPLPNSIARGGFLAIIIITALSSLICLSLVVFPHLWRCICGMMVKCSLYLHGVLNARKT